MPPDPAPSIEHKTVGHESAVDTAESSNQPSAKGPKSNRHYKHKHKSSNADNIRKSTIDNESMSANTKDAPVAGKSNNLGGTALQTDETETPHTTHKPKKSKAPADKREKHEKTNTVSDKNNANDSSSAAGEPKPRPPRSTFPRLKEPTHKKTGSTDSIPKLRKETLNQFTEDERRSLDRWRDSTIFDDADFEASGVQTTQASAAPATPLFRDLTQKKKVLNVVKHDSWEDASTSAHASANQNWRNPSDSKMKSRSGHSHQRSLLVEEVDYKELDRQLSAGTYKKVVSNASKTKGQPEHNESHAQPVDEIHYDDLGKQPVTRHHKPHYAHHADPSTKTPPSAYNRHHGKAAGEKEHRDAGKRVSPQAYKNLFRKHLHKSFVPATAQGVNDNVKLKRDSDSNDWRATAAPPPSPAQTSNSSSAGERLKKRTYPDDYNPRRRREFFKPFRPASEVAALLDAKKLYKGTIRINKRNRQDAYVTSDELDHDIYIHSAVNRNRALEGDIVAVELRDVDEVWNVKKAKDEKDADKKKEQDEARQDDREIVIIPKEIDSSENDDDDEDKRKPKYCGVVVAILDRSLEPMLTGTICLERPNAPANEPTAENKSAENDQKHRPPPRTFWIKPTDKRVPFVCLPIRQCPHDFIENKLKYANKIFVARITKWPITERHPFGEIVKELGNVGELEVEAKALLAEHNVNDQEFPEAALACLPETPWSIPAKEYKKRQDLRFHRIFSIDPETAKDLDDAVHITDKGDGMFEVGVHIADVSYFIKSKSALDTEARSRGTSVYLVDRVIPMLPSLLCEQLCSLNPGVERLAFSVIWQMDEYGEIHDTWFGRTIIKSCAKLAYHHAQDVIEGKPLSKNILLHGHDASAVQKDILDLFNISKHLRKARYANGALSMNSVKLSFDLDDEGKPIECHVYEQKDANRLIEEFMLCANISVAKKIASQYPDQALLRRHAPPIERRLDEFLLQAECLGYVFDGSSAGALQASFNEIESEEVKETMLILAIKPMQRAKYFCTGFLDISKYMHYALNVPMYTHFTSPIRRYADVIVHRQLEAALSDVERFPVDGIEIAKIAQQCNIKKDGAKNAQDASIQLYLAEYLHRHIELHGPMYCNAIVIAVLDNAYDIFVPEFGIEKRLHLDRMALKKSTHDATNHTLILQWREDVSEMVEPEVVATALSFDEDDTDIDELTDAIDKQLCLDEGNMEETSDGHGLNETATESVADEQEHKDCSSQEDPNDHKASLDPLSSETGKRDGTYPPENQSDGQVTTNDTQIIKVFGRVTIRLDVNMERSPPIINVHSVNPRIYKIEPVS